MKCIGNLDYNIRMSKHSLHKFIMVFIIIISLATLSGCGNKGPLIHPTNIISINK